jgi:hypothetical protein
MILTGTTTVVTHDVKVNVSCDQLLGAVREAIEFANPSFSGVTYINDGKVYTYDGCNHHTGGDEFIVLRDATHQDVALLKMWDDLQTWVYELHSPKEWVC